MHQKNSGKIRKTVPNIALRTTFIVGYPGENEEQFNNLLNFAKETNNTKSIDPEVTLKAFKELYNFIIDIFNDIYDDFIKKNTNFLPKVTT